MSTQRGRDDADNCFVCGPRNPIGLRLKFRMEGDVCVGEFRPGDNHCGYDGMTHGGIIYSALDDVMANWLFLRGIRAYTAKSEVRYHRPLATGTLVRLEARCRKQRRNLVVMHGQARDEDPQRPVAECEARFMVDSSRGFQNR